MLKPTRRALNAAIPFAKTLIAKNDKLERENRQLREQNAALKKEMADLEARRAKHRDRELANILLAVGGYVHVKKQAALTARIDYSQSNIGRDHHYRLLDS